MVSSFTKLHRRLNCDKSHTRYFGKSENNDIYIHMKYIYAHTGKEYTMLHKADYKACTETCILEQVQHSRTR